MSDWNLLEGFQTQGQVYGQAYENMLDRWTQKLLLLQLSEVECWW